MLIKRGVIISITLFVIIFFASNVIAGLYSYNDSMELKYRIIDNNVVYGYGNETSTKYVTSLRPLDKNWSEWKPEVRREKVDLTWTEIDEAIKSDKTIQEALRDRQNNFVLNNLVTGLVNKISNSFLAFFKKEDISINSRTNINTNFGGMCIKE